MGSEGRESRENLPLFSLPTLRNLKHSGNLNSPLHTLASVPFRWEEQPGKPLPSNALSLSSHSNCIPKCLDLPPRLLFNAKLITKTPSPTTALLDDTCHSAVGRSISFRFLRKGQVSSDVASESTFILNNRKDKGLFRSWRKKTGGLSIKNSSTESEIHEGDFVFPGFPDDATGSGDGGATMVARVSGKRSDTGLSQAKSHFWATIYGTFKQAIPRRRTTWKKDAQ